MQSVRLIQFTDMHLFGDSAGRLRGVATLPALQAAIADADRRYQRPDGILLTGDLVQDDPGGYRWIRHTFGASPVPVLCLAGNHDLPDHMRSALSQPPFSVGGHAKFGHVLLCLHHQPIAMRSDWLDQVGLSDAEEFMAVVREHSNIRGVLWGHVHQSLDSFVHGVRFMASPATCAQFLPGSRDFALDSRPPGYRVLELMPDGAIQTEVCWLESYAQSVVA